MYQLTSDLPQQASLKNFVDMEVGEIGIFVSDDFGREFDGNFILCVFGKRWVNLNHPFTTWSEISRLSLLKVRPVPAGTKIVIRVGPCEDDLSLPVSNYLKRGEFIHAIRQRRQETGESLVDAKTFVERFRHLMPERKSDD